MLNTTVKSCEGEEASYIGRAVDLDIPVKAYETWNHVDPTLAGQSGAPVGGVRISTVKSTKDARSRICFCPELKSVSVCRAPTAPFTGRCRPISTF